MLQQQTKRLSNDGQSLIELVIALAIGGIFITSSASAIYLVLRNSLEVRTNQIATAIAQEYFDNLNTISYSRWLEIYCPPSGICPGDVKGFDSQFFLTASSTTYILNAGASSTIIDGENFTRSFSIENVNRTKCGIGDVSGLATTTCSFLLAGDSDIAADFSTQKITVKVNWRNNGSLIKPFYLTRYQNFNFKQSDWSAGPNQDFFSTSTGFTIINDRFSSSTNINFLGGSEGYIQQNSTSSNAELVSSIFQFFSQPAGQSKVSINTIGWRGNLNGNPAANVGFQIAVSNDTSGPWNYNGHDGTSGTYYSGNPEITIPVNLRYNNNYKYFRYKVFFPVSSQPFGPKVDEISVSWSP